MNWFWSNCRSVFQRRAAARRAWRGDLPQIEDVEILIGREMPHSSPYEGFWVTPSSHPKLQPDEVHVWCASLDGDLPIGSCLSIDELERANRFVFEEHRRRFTAARSILRRLLGAYLGLPPEVLAFSYTRHGKPYLAEQAGGVRFNLSHSQGVALYAVSRGREVGIDVERMQGSPSSIAGFFSAEERVALDSLPRQDQAEAFCKLWARREAYLKARGEGLFSAGRPFRVAVSSYTPPVVDTSLGDPQEAARWSLHDLPLESGFAAAIAVEGHGWSLKCWKWRG